MNKAQPRYQWVGIGALLVIILGGIAPEFIPFLRDASWSTDIGMYSLGLAAVLAEVWAVMWWRRGHIAISNIALILVTIITLGASAEIFNYVHENYFHQIRADDTPCSSLDSSEMAAGQACLPVSGVR